MSLFNSVMFGINILIILLMGGMTIVTPYILRRSLLFGTRVPEAVHEQPEVKALKKQYAVRGLVLLGVMAAAAILQFVLLPGATMLTVMYLPLIYAALSLVIYYPCHQEAIAMKQKNNWQPDPRIKADTSSALIKQTLKGLPWSWYIASLIVLLGICAYAAYQYPHIPNRFPTHWGPDMQPDKYSDKSVLTVLTMPLIGFAMIIVFILSNVAIFKMKLQVSTENPALSFAQHRLYRRILSHYLGLITLATAVGIALMAPSSMGLANLETVPFLTGLTVYLLLTIIPIVIISLKAGQSGFKLKPAILPKDADGKYAPVLKEVFSGRDDDRFWKLGLFYYNKEDPSVFVEDRFGLNGGLNYARLSAKLFVALMTAILVVTYATITVLWATAPEQFLR